MKFNYDEFITRNIGFVSKKEQNLIKEARVFVAGAGGMGGAAIACLARMGVENFIIADLDEFEVSNLNRQIFANLNTVGKDKALQTKEALLNINPNVQIELHDHSWVEKLEEILTRIDVVVNGCDDTRATLILMRMAAKFKVTVIDAFASTLPSVYSIQPNDKRPEEIMNYPSIGRAIETLSDEELDLCAKREIEYVMIHSSTAKHVILDIAAEMVSGKRSRISFAPMVWMTGCLMAFEVTKVILGKEKLASARGVFINPWSFKIEKPINSIFAFFKGIAVRTFLNRLMKD